MTEAVPVRVLLVEDDEDDVVLARQSLRDIDPAGFVVDWAPEFDDALTRLRDPDRYDVCLADYHLGAHDGVDLVRRARDKGCTVPIILLTGLGDRSVDVAAMNAGAADFLNKNQLTPAVLERSIRYAIQHRRAEEQRIGLLKEQAARREAEAANQAKDQFLAVLSHELRTPLSAVLLTLSALEEEGGASPAMREMVEVIKRNVDLEARLIDDLLDLTRIARGKLEIRREIVDLHRQIEFAVKTCCGADIEQKRLTVTVHTDAPIHHVWGDPARLQQVLWNLIKNAAKFTPAGGRIEVRTSNANGHGGTAKRLRVEVSDTGIGIPPDALPKIFKAFEQADRNITRQFGGLGLGLAICKALVDLHGGRISAHSEGAGRGATFSVDLPALAAAELKPRGTGDLSETAVAPSLGGRSVSILLVEDHADTARAMSLLLRRRGYAVRAANSLADALSVAEGAPFDIVISDIGLPDGSGLDLMRALRERGPIIGIALSGYGMEEDLERSRAAGFTEHLTKPVDFRQLETVIARLVRRDSAPTTPTTAPVGHT